MSRTDNKEAIIETLAVDFINDFCDALDIDTNEKGLPVLPPKGSAKRKEMMQMLSVALTATRGFFDMEPDVTVTIANMAKEAVMFDLEMSMQ